MSRRIYVGSVGRERTLVLRHEDEGLDKYELIPRFRPVPPPAHDRRHDSRHDSRGAMR